MPRRYFGLQSYGNGKSTLFGATGNLGKQIAAELKKAGYLVTAVVRNEKKEREMAGLAHQCIVADVMKKSTLPGICNGFPIIISALGKSVSINDRSKPSFYDVDFGANSTILDEAVKSRVSKFVYISAYGAERLQHLEYFRVHHLFSEKLKASGLDYSIIKPPALFSAFLDLIPMARKGQVLTLGSGDKYTNPIYEGDLARICVEAIHLSHAEIEAGGREVLSRHEINEVIQLFAAPQKKVHRIPIGLVKALLPVIRLFSRNFYDKMAFFVAVMQHDMIAPRVGDTTLASYLKRKLSTPRSQRQSA
jgi:uncharacterized protein YbjT (DUF2867 family)